MFIISAEIEEQNINIYHKNFHFATPSSLSTEMIKIIAKNWVEISTIIHVGHVIVEILSVVFSFK